MTSMAVKNRSPNRLNVAAVMIWLCALLPILITPWISDDMAFSIAFRDAVVGDALGKGIEWALSFSSQGRVAFLHLVMLNFVYAIFKNVYAYKIFLVLINLFPFFAFNKLCKTLGLNNKEFLLMTIMLAATVQIRGSADPYVSFFGMVQCCTGFMLLSINSFLKDKSWSAALWAALALQFYEVGYVLLPIVVAICITRYFLGQGFKFRNLIPLTLVTVLYLFVSVALRKLAATDGGTVEYAYSMVFQPWKILQTVGMQMAGALPLDYLMLTDRSGNSGVDIKTAKVLWFFLLAFVVLFPVYMFLRLKKSERWQLFADQLAPRKNEGHSVEFLLLILVIGLLLWALPGGIIAVSPKYQGEGVVRWSQPYIPAYTATYGVALVVYGVYAFVVKKVSLGYKNAIRFVPVMFVFIAAVSNFYNWNNAFLLREAWGKQYPIKELVWSDGFKESCAGLVYTSDKMYWTNRLLDARGRNLDALPSANQIGENDCVLIADEPPRYLKAAAYAVQTRSN
jgi:hypothetical protein